MNPLITTISWSLLTLILTFYLLDMLGIKKWMKKKYYKDYFFYTILTRIIATCILVGLVASFTFFIPYYDNLRMEQKYGIKEITNQVLGNPELMVPLDKLPKWLIEGTQKLTLVDEPLGTVRTEVGECLVGTIFGAYINETDEVLIYINDNGFADLEITWHEFSHRLWDVFMTSDEQSAFLELHNFECEKPIVFITGLSANGNNYYRDCWLMDTGYEEFAYKLGWFILDKNHERLSDKEILYFSKLLRNYDLAEISDKYRLREAVALLRSTDGIRVNIDTT